MSAPTTPRLLTAAECRAWAERYKSTPFNMLALSVATDKQASPMLVMRSLFEALARAQDALAFIVNHPYGIGDHEPAVVARNALPADWEPA